MIDHYYFCVPCEVKCEDLWLTGDEFERPSGSQLIAKAVRRPWEGGALNGVENYACPPVWIDKALAARLIFDTNDWWYRRGNKEWRIVDGDGKSSEDRFNEFRPNVAAA